MAYTRNPNIPRVRREAAYLVVHHGWSTRKVARRFGINQSTVVRWAAQARAIGYHPIPTKSSRPKRHPRQLSAEMVRTIVQKRLEINRSAEVVHKALTEDGVTVSLSSVKRTLDREHLLKKRWKKTYRPPISRPSVVKPGDLVQLDTIHLMRGRERIYVFTGIDVCTRFAWAWASEKANTRTALRFLRRFEHAAPFDIGMLQTDNGSEFSRLFSERARVAHRHSRVRRPNDNAHLERFNRTLQEELVRSLPVDVDILNKALPAYLNYYNQRRYHFGLNLKTPLQVMQSY